MFLQVTAEGAPALGATATRSLVTEPQGHPGIMSSSTIFFNCGRLPPDAGGNRTRAGDHPRAARLHLEPPVRVASLAPRRGRKTCSPTATDLLVCSVMWFGAVSGEKSKEHLAQRG